MAAFYHFPASHSLSTRKLLFYSPLPLPNSRFNHCTVFACSVKKPSTRTRRKVKCNDDLFNDIREFLYSAGLPEHHVPSTKELSQHGRQDLANIVRRRGYKFIKQLLQTSSIENIDTSQSENLEALNGSEGQNEKSKSLADDILPSEATQEGEIHRCKETHGDLKPIVQSSLTLEEKVARFMQHGELDTVEDIGLRAVYDRYGDEAERNVESDDAYEPELPFNYQQPNDLSLRSSNGAESLNGKASSSALKVEDPVLERGNSRDSYISTEECTSVDLDKDLDVEVCNQQNMENEAEIKRLKFMLHQKEMELTQLKQQIEKEKLALPVLQATVETEINKAHKLVSEKETELHAAEESLSGLKEVEIQYSGEGETVELAGSFNGWHQKIQMEPQSSTTEPDGSRTCRHWKAVLWLYPGVYEIKFVVDGHWKIDPDRELITARGSIHNNILRVDR